MCKECRIVPTCIVPTMWQRVQGPLYIVLPVLFINFGVCAKHISYHACVFSLLEFLSLAAVEVIQIW